MVIKCSFEDADFITKNGAKLIVSNETTQFDTIRLEVYNLENNTEEIIFIDGKQLIKAIQSCMTGR